MEKGRFNARLLIAAAALITGISIFIVIDFVQYIFGSFNTVINSLIKFFRDPDWSDIILIVIGIVIGWFCLFVVLGLIIIAILLWYHALTSISRKKRPPVFLKKAKKAFNKTIKSWFNIVWSIRKTWERTKKKSRLYLFKKTLFPKIKNKSLTTRFPGKLFPWGFWITALLAWVSYEFFSLATFSVFLILLAICTIWILITGSFKEQDRLILNYLKEEIKECPKRFIDFFRLAAHSMVWAIALTLLLLLIKGEIFPLVELSSFFLKAWLHFVFFLVIIYSLAIIIYSVRKIGGSRTAETLGGISASMCLAAGYFNQFIPKTWGTLVFWIYYLLGFTASFLIIFHHLKKFPFKKKRNFYRELFTVLFKFVSMVFFSAVIIELLVSFLILGIYPGTTGISQECSQNLLDGTRNFLESAEVFNEFIVQTGKGLEDGDFSSITQAYYKNTHIQEAIRSFTSLKKNAASGLSASWHHINLFGLYYWVADSMLIIMDYMYVDIPSLFEFVKEHQRQLSEFADIFRQKKNFFHYLLAIANPRHQANYHIVKTMLKLLIKCNNRYESLKPPWAWRLVPNIGKFHRFMLGMEARVWVMLNYIDLKNKYKDDFIVVKRCQVLFHARSIPAPPNSIMKVATQIFPFDEKIIIYLGIGEINLD